MTGKRSQGTTLTPFMDYAAGGGSGPTSVSSTMRSIRLLYLRQTRSLLFRL
jgi:hypothetical protein